MKNKFEKNTLKFLYLFGLASLLFVLKRQPLKDWLLVFFMKSYFASLADNAAVKKGYVKYPVRLGS
ncbi:hypothetical protein [Metabacillus sp. RGM 3146]|uniref:hypothetical protein n=1 Tax=Metabacillus sp. RGM 3146 TaxID=3401092 RepID=UPI003B9ACC83